MIDKTPGFVADSGKVSSGGLHCESISCAVHHGPHVSFVAQFLSWLFG